MEADYMIKFKIDVMQELKKNGYNSSKIVSERLISGQTLQQIRRGNARLHTSTLDTICRITGLQPGDVIMYVPDDTADHVTDQTD